MKTGRRERPPWRSISRNLTLSLLSILILVEGALLLVVYHSQSQAMLRQVQVRADDYITNLGQVLAVPIWDFDDEQIARIGSGFAKYALVESIRIDDASGKPLFAAHKQRPHGKMIRRSVIIRHKDQIVGRATLEVSLADYAKDLIWLRNVLALILAGSFAVILITTGILLRVFMRKPLAILQKRMDRIARGDFRQPVDPVSYRELAGIAGRFGEMARKIQARENSLQQINAKLGAEISQRKQVESALRQSEARYRAFFEEDLSGAYISRADGTLVACNPAFATIFGFSSTQAAMRINLATLYPHAADRQRFIARLKAEKKLERYESTMVGADGNSIHIVENAVGVFDKQGNLTEIKGYLIDVTGQKNLEMQLQQATKMEAVGTLAGGIAHDFNNLLMGIEGNISLMLHDLPAGHAFEERLRQIEKNVHSGAKLTSQLLGYARKGRYQVKLIDINRVIQETSQTFARARKEIQVHHDLAADLLAVEADPGQIEQVLLNLFVNAADAMPTGGDLFIATRNVTADDIRDRVPASRPGRYVLLEVRDTGMGMDRKTRQRIFDPFFTTKSMGRGTGLGLASVYGIVKGHDGQIEVISEKGRGATFIIYLPASSKPLQEEKTPSGKLIKGSETILLIDDEEVVLNVASKMLQSLGYTVLSAGGGREGVSLFRRQHDIVDMVILDMIMPEMSGSEAFDALKRIDPTVKVLLSSGYSIDGQAARIMERGCNGFIQKPFNLATLSQKIRTILDPPFP